MSSPDLVLPNRLEELLGGAFPETEQEARMQGLARELRAGTPAASAALRARVGGVSRAPREPRFGRRARSAIVFAVLGGLVAAAIAGSFVSDGSLSGEGSEGGGVLKPLQRHVDHGAAAGDSYAPAFGRAQLLPIGRAQDVDMWITLRVKDAGEVSDRSQEAMAITRELGGVVVSSTLSTGGNRGQARLTLEIPTARVEDAAFRLSELGTVTGRRVVTADLQAPIDRTVQRIEHLRSAIRIAKARLASGLIDAEEGLQMQIRVERLRTRLRDAMRTHAALAARAAMADLTLSLDTGSTPEPKKSEGGVAGAAGTAFDILKGAGAVAVFLVILLSPLVLLVVLAWLALRERGRRIEKRLLDEPQPASPRPRSG